MVTGATVMLPRQVGSKDAPDVILSQRVVPVARERSESVITEVSSVPRTKRLNP